MRMMQSAEPRENAILSETSSQELAGNGEVDLNKKKVERKRPAKVSATASEGSPKKITKQSSEKQVEEDEKEDDTSGGESEEQHGEQNPGSRPGGIEIENRTEVEIECEDTIRIDGVTGRGVKDGADIRIEAQGARPGSCVRQISIANRTVLCTRAEASIATANLAPQATVSRFLFSVPTQRKCLVELAARTVKSSGYSSTHKLSPALAELMGTQEMSRQEVSKRVKAKIGPYAKSDGSYAISEDGGPLRTIFGKKRFGMDDVDKHLEKHIHT
ncbi:hypothetical protein EVAR_44520_1 [Eumeta japonica]|uniref:Uncharacterized protein n=1 Tax=Eumeta variegata TaxID=151549 RepID=A0A4C1YEB4_EUMVA|nr:hypothetical protein EVAR_44520_1 [Eumeta japonica]